MKIKKLISSMLLCTVLSGCSDSSISHEIPLEQSNCPISTMRTGTYRQCIKSMANGFECTQEGSYFMHIEPTIGSWLLYTDHGSDTVIKLCGRPDCNHNDRDCNAFFNKAYNICYYDGFLYTFDYKDSFSTSSGDLIHMNLDGTERVSVYNTASFVQASGYRTVDCPIIFNGMLFLLCSNVDETGTTVSECYYYKLDGSMDEPKIDSFFEPFLRADGESVVGPVDYDEENDLFIYGLWHPEKGVTAEFFKAKDIVSYGYIGTKARYYIEDGIIIEDSYTDGKTELIDTGLNGNYRLACFPDCMVIYKYLTDEEKLQGVTLEGANLYFYDWDCNDLGSVKINYKLDGSMTGFICGETPERIILTDDYFCTPHYYINKSDFGTGNIEIHALNVPDFETE